MHPTCIEHEVHFISFPSATCIKLNSTVWDVSNDNKIGEGSVVSDIYRVAQQGKIVGAMPSRTAENAILEHGMTVAIINDLWQEVKLIL